MPRRFAIYGEGAAAPPPAFSAQTVSVEFNGTDENMFNNSPQVYGIADAWSIGLWWKPGASAFATNNRLLGFDRTTSGEYSITMSMMGGVGQDPVRMEIYDEFGAILKRWDWWNATVSGEWNFHVATWDGTDLQLYAHGELRTPSAKPVDNADSLADTSSRKLYIARSDEADYSDARIHSVGMWNSVLSGVEVAALRNTGIGNVMDWGVDAGGYVSSAALQHWWRLGNDSGNIGADSGKGITIDVGADASNITAGDDIVADAPDSFLFVPDRFCVDFNGADERMGNEAEQAFDIANAWTLATWFKPRAAVFANESRLFSLRRGPAASNNFILLDIAGDVANDPVRVGLWDSAASLFKLYTWESLAVQDAWNMLTVTWDGSSLLLYHDGTLIAPTTSGTDDAGTMTDDANRILRVGAAASTRWFDGRIHSAGLWDVVLTSGEQAALYNSGDGNAVDWGNDGGGYSSSADLQHWWQLGRDSGDIGADSGVAGAIDLMDDAANITAALDVIEDAP